MTDAAVAPAEAGGVPIEHSQTPNPVETSSPAAKPDEVSEGQPPKGEERRSIEDALKEADKKVKAKESEPKEAKEPAKAEKKEAEPKEKAEKTPEPTKEAAESGEDGKLKAKATEDTEEPEKPVTRQSSHPDAPSRFDDAAKAEWEKVGENTRGAVHRMQRELEQGIEKYRADAENFESVRRYADMAKESGTDLRTALENYTNIEKELRRDPIAGLQAVVANLGLKGPNGQPATLRDIAGFVLNQKPDQVASRQEATISSLKGEIAELNRKLSDVTGHVNQQVQQARAKSVTQEWDSFRTANPNAGKLEAEMADFLTKYPAGENVPVRERLSDALAWAEARHPDKIAAHPAPVAAQTRETPDPGQKSISGAPASGSDPTLPAKTKGQNISIEDSIKRAAARLAS